MQQDDWATRPGPGPAAPLRVTPLLAMRDNRGSMLIDGLIP